MNKQGWKEVIERYYLSTDLVHDREQFANRIMQLKGLWGFCNRLRNDTGLGHKEDGTVDAPDEWWKQNTMVNCLTATLLFNMKEAMQFISTIRFAGQARMEETEERVACLFG